MDMTIRHRWILDEDGRVDDFRLDSGYHNGPQCSVCDESFCQHCTDPDSLVCEGAPVAPVSDPGAWWANMPDDALDTGDTDPAEANALAAIIIDFFDGGWVPLDVRYGIAHAILREYTITPKATPHAL